jgi:plasmid maintenance system antidote protein VapI
MDTLYEKKLLDYILALGLNQNEIANHLGIHRAHVHRWIHGSRPVPHHYRSQLLGLIEQTLSCLLARLEARLEGTREERLKASKEIMHLVDGLEGLIDELHEEDALENAARALEAMQALPPGALRSQAYTRAIAECAMALLRYADIFAACGPLIDFMKEVKRDLVREFAELRDDGQAGAVH